jgi:hypothetical protein
MSDIFKKLEYTMDKRSLKEVVFGFIQPQLEYDSHISDDCSQHDSNELEKFL